MQIRPPCSLGGGLRERDLLSLVQRRRRKRERERGEGGRAHPFLGAWRAGRAGPARAGESLCERFFRQPLKSSGYYYLTL